jgi:hypothetical protein
MGYRHYVNLLLIRDGVEESFLYKSLQDQQMGIDVVPVVDKNGI